MGNTYHNLRKLQSAHGGTDSGKVGINGVKEKDINLTITNSVKKILEKENFLKVNRKKIIILDRGDML